MRAHNLYVSLFKFDLFKIRISLESTPKKEYMVNIVMDWMLVLVLVLLLWTPLHKRWLLPGSLNANVSGFPTRQPPGGDDVSYSGKQSRKTITKENGHKREDLEQLGP